MWWTLVRLHREGEGAGYTGLKPAGRIDPAVKLADEALRSGSVDRLVAVLQKRVGELVRKRFEAALAHRKRVDANVSAGRQFIASYVEYFVERLHNPLKTKPGEHKH